MKIRNDFDPETAFRRIGGIRTQLNHLVAVDQLGGLEGGKDIIKEMWSITNKAVAINRKAILEKNKGEVK